MKNSKTTRIGQQLLLAAAAVSLLATSASAAVTVNVGACVTSRASSALGGSSAADSRTAGGIGGASACHNTTGTSIYLARGAFRVHTDSSIHDSGYWTWKLGYYTGSGYPTLRTYCHSRACDTMHLLQVATSVAGTGYEPGEYASHDYRWASFISYAHEIGHNLRGNHDHGICKTTQSTIMKSGYCGSATVLSFFSGAVGATGWGDSTHNNKSRIYQYRYTAANRR